MFLNTECTVHVCLLYRMLRIATNVVAYFRVRSLCHTVIPSRAGVILTLRLTETYQPVGSFDTIACSSQDLNNFRSSFLCYRWTVFIHLVVCLTTGTRPLPMRALHSVLLYLWQSRLVQQHTDRMHCCFSTATMLRYTYIAYLLRSAIN
jgi:hypothetical protein